MKTITLKKHKLKAIVAACLCLCLGLSTLGQVGLARSRALGARIEANAGAYGEGLDQRLYDMSSRFNGKFGVDYGSDSTVSNTDSGLPNAPIVGNGNVGLVLGGSSVGQSLNVGMNDFWQGTYNPDNISGTSPLPVGAIGYTVLDGSDASNAAADVDLATKYTKVTDSGASGSGPAFAVSGDYVSTSRGGSFWQANRGDGAWLQLEFAEAIEFQRIAVWNAGSCMYNAASGGDMGNLRDTGYHYWNTYAFRVQVSDNGTAWKDVFKMTKNYHPIVDRDLDAPARGKYVRLYIDDASSSPSDGGLARISKFSLYANPKNDPNLMPELVNGDGTPIKASTNCVETGDGGHIYTSSDLYATVCGTVQHLAGYGTTGVGWFTGVYPTEEKDYITYRLNRKTDFKSYQLHNGTASSPGMHGRGALRGWVVETSQDGGATFNEVHRVSPPTSQADNPALWGGQPAISSFDIATDKIQYTTNVDQIRVRVSSIHGARALMSQFKIFAGTLAESKIRTDNEAMFYQNLRDGRVGTEAKFNGKSYKADTFMGQQDSGDYNHVVTNFTNDSDQDMTFRYYTFAHRYDNPGYCQSAKVTDDKKTLYSTQTTRTDQLKNLAWLSAATIAATLEDGTPWSNTGTTVGNAYGEFTVPAKSSKAVIAYVDGREYFPDFKPMPYQNINATNSPTIQAAIKFSQTGVAADIAHQSNEWWKTYWTKSYVDISTADKAAEKYYYFSQYISGCASRQDNVPVSLFGPFITSNTPAWAGCYTTDYNTYGPYQAMAGSNRVESLKPLVRNTLESWGGVPGLGTGIGRDYAERINSLHGMGDYKIPGTNEHLFKNGVAGILSGVRSSPHGYAYDNGGFYGIVFTTAYAAIPLITYMDMTQGTGEVAPGVVLTREVEYNYLKDMMELWEQLLYYENGTYRLRFDSAWEDEPNRSANSFSLAAVHRFTTRLIEDAEMLGITMAEEPRLAKWADIHKNIEPFPSGMTADASGRKRLSFSDTTESANQGYVTVKGLSYNNPNVVSAQVFPVGMLGLYSNPDDVQKMRNSITTARFWNQMNAQPTVFSTAARVGYSEYNEEEDFVGFDGDLKSLLAQYGKTTSSNMAHNSISGLFDPLQLIDTVGGAQGLNDMLVQRSQDIVTFFPAFPKDKSAKFRNIQVTGGILVSGEYDGVTQKVVAASIHHKFGGKINVAVPKGVKWKVVDAEGRDVLVTRNVVGSLVGYDAYNNIASISFDAAAGQTYTIVEM